MAALGVTSGTAKVYEVRVLASIPVAMAEEGTKGRKKGRGRLVRRFIFGKSKEENAREEEKKLTGNDLELQEKKRTGRRGWFSLRTL